MDTTGKRLTYLIESVSDSKLVFCKKNKINYNSIVPITNDKRAIGLNIIKDLMVAFPTLNINWLLFGQGNINIVKNDYVEQINVLKEPEEKMTKDLVEEIFIKYLDNIAVRKKILSIVNDEKY